eukprot:gene4352-3166_t
MLLYIYIVLFHHHQQHLHRVCLYFLDIRLKNEHISKTVFSFFCPFVLHRLIAHSFTPVSGAMRASEKNLPIIFRCLWNHRGWRNISISLGDFCRRAASSSTYARLDQNNNKKKRKRKNLLKVLFHLVVRMSVHVCGRWQPYITFHDDEAYMHSCRSSFYDPSLKVLVDIEIHFTLP